MANRKEREPVEAVLVRKQRHEGSMATVYGQPGHADYFMAEYMYCDGNRDRKYTCYCIGNPPQSIYLTSGMRKCPVGEFASRSTTDSRGFTAYSDGDTVHRRMVGLLFVPGVVAFAFIIILLLARLFGA